MVPGTRDSNDCEDNVRSVEDLVQSLAETVSS
jgi:hypothetical protein